MKYVAVMLGVFSTLAHAELKPLADDELGLYSGQAAVAFDIDQLGSNTHTKLTVGLEADLQMNIDTLEFGRYDQTGQTLPADLAATNLGFGSISTDSAQVQLDGNTYAVNEIVPFELNDPYFEMAQNASDELVGFRLGFGEARGQLTADFTSFSGQIGVEVTDFFGNTYDAQLLDNSANQINSRAQYFGVSSADSGGAASCATGFYCYDIANYNTFDVGQRNETTGTVDYTNDFFISFQTQATEWTTSDGSVTAQTGIHFNLPTSMSIDMNSGLNTTGTDRVRTEFIDRGNGLF